ncbi:MAG: helix-turn-helix domain-containing protein [Bdellovibrionales bacterium]|nr:helix-turn-helix domain-containing protein [Bdellovibrionales bacterium]
MDSAALQAEKFFDNKIELDRISHQTGVPLKYLVQLFSSRWFLEWHFEECLVSKEQLSEKLDISVSFVNKLMRIEGLPHVKLGKLVRFRISDIQSWLQRRRMP